MFEESGDGGVVRLGIAEIEVDQVLEIDDDGGSQAELGGAPSRSREFITPLRQIRRLRCWRSWWHSVAAKS